MCLHLGEGWLWKRFSWWSENWKMRKWMQILAKHEWRNFLCFESLPEKFSITNFDIEWAAENSSPLFTRSNFKLPTASWQHVKKLFQFLSTLLFEINEERRVKGWVLFQGEECRKIYLRALSEMNHLRNIKAEFLQGGEEKLVSRKFSTRTCVQFFYCH